jgi:GntR family galactonate operon transcriptional repressor
VKGIQKRSFRRGRLSEQVLNEIEKLIADEYQQPGARLPKEDELADRFHVSRIVVREAMKILEDRGVVEVVAGRGTFTLTPSPHRVKASLLRLFKDQPIPTILEMERMLELREVLEETVAGLAAVRATPEDLLEMEAALKGMDSGGSDPVTVEADLRFHLAVARAAHNQFLQMVIEPLTEVFLQQIKVTDSFDVGVELHRNIYTEIRRGNPVGARQAVRKMMKSTLAHCRKALSVVYPSSNGQ